MASPSRRVPDDLRRSLADWRSDFYGTFVAHFGVKGAIPPAALTAGAEAATVLIGFAGEEDVIAHLDAVSTGGVPSRPSGTVTVTSRLDPRQASAGPYGPLHTIRYETLAPVHHPSASWDRARREYRAACWSMLGATEATRLLFEFADSPTDLERRFATTRNGSMRQGRLSIDQAGPHRPHTSCSTGRTPVDGFYLGGGAIHPGVPGSLGGGYNAAAVVCEDLGLERWWPSSGAAAGSQGRGPGGGDAV